MKIEIKRNHNTKYKTSLSRRKAVKAWQEKQFDKGCCKVCGNKMDEDDLRIRCKACNHWHNIRLIANRAFLRDFK